MLRRSPRPHVAFERPDLLGYRHALAGQGRFVGLKIRRFDEPGVGRDLVAGFDQDDVAGNDVMGCDPLSLAVANDGGFRRGQRHQGPHGLLGARLLDEAEHRVQDDDRHDDDRLVGKRGLARVLQQPFDNRDDRRDQQNDHQEILELLQQPLPPRRFRRTLQPVRPVLLEAPPRFGSVRPRAMSEPSAETTASAGSRCGVIGMPGRGRRCREPREQPPDCVSF